VQDSLEIRFLIARVVCRSLELGIAEGELVSILTRSRGSIDEMVEQPQLSIDVELRLRRLLEVFELVEEFCTDRSRDWLRKPNPLLALQTPIETLSTVPEALNGFLGLLRSMRPSNESEGNGYETCKQIFQLID